MRMDQSQSITAWDVVNTYDLDELTRIIREYEKSATPSVSPIR